MCSSQESSGAKSEAATIASGCHTIIFYSHEAISAKSARPGDAVRLQNHSTFVLTHTDKMHAQYSIYLSSNFKPHVIASDVEPESNLDHQLKVNWRDFVLAFCSPHKREVIIE